MKTSLLLFSLCILIGLPIRNINPACPTDEKCIAVLDSARQLVKNGAFSINWEPITPDKKRGLALSKWFEKRSFFELQCLLQSQDKLYRLYGYMYATMFHPDSLQNNYAELFKDTTALQFVSDNGKLEDSKMTLGTVLTEMSAEIVKTRENRDKKPVVEKVVSSFIKSYSAYPNSYMPVDFPSFSFGTFDEGKTEFNIRHRYRIRDNNNQMIQVTSAFVLNGDFGVEAIEDSSTYLSADPPKLDSWLKGYGRRLNHSDSATLRLNE